MTTDSPLVRPASLETSIKLWVAAAAISLVHSVLQLINTNPMIDELSKRTGVSLEQAKTTVTGVGSVIFGIVIIGVWLLVVWQMRAGRNWARIVLTVLGGLVAILGFVGLFGASLLVAIGFLGTLDLVVSVLYIAALGAAIYYQFRPDSNQFFTRA